MIVIEVSVIVIIQWSQIIQYNYFITYNKGALKFTLDPLKILKIAEEALKMCPRSKNWKGKLKNI